MIRVPNLTPQDVDKFAALFEKSGAVDGLLQGTYVMLDGSAWILTFGRQYCSRHLPALETPDSDAHPDLEPCRPEGPRSTGLCGVRCGYASHQLL